MTICKAAQLYLDGYEAGEYGFTTGFNGWKCPETVRSWATMSLISVIRCLTEIKHEGSDSSAKWILHIFEQLKEE